jgi:3-oxoacyl-[acyl-carrier-protein] synthase I
MHERHVLGAGACAVGGSPVSARVPPLAIHRTGLVTSVGYTAPASCAAIRCKLTNPSETRFIDSSGEWIMAHQVELEKPWRGLTKLAKMAAMAIDEALHDIPKPDWVRIPLLLCVAEKDRPGRLDGLDDQLFGMVQDELGARFHERSAIVAHGRVAVAAALSLARGLMEQGIPYVLIAATDSLVTWPTLSVYEREGRLLTPTNSNGFMPGEGAGALVVGRPAGAPCLHVTGLGFSIEKAHINADEPLRGDGMAQAFKAALAEAGIQMHHVDYRITDLSGEQYYFKEAALALSRTLRVRKEEFDIWHPAECTGEVGALAGASVLAVADAACRKAYTKGPNIIAHMASDIGNRSVINLQWSA